MTDSDMHNVKKGSETVITQKQASGGSESAQNQDQLNENVNESKSISLLRKGDEFAHQSMKNFPLPAALPIIRSESSSRIKLMSAKPQIEATQGGFPQVASAITEQNPASKLFGLEKRPSSNTSQKRRATLELFVSQSSTPSSSTAYKNKSFVSQQPLVQTNRESSEAPSPKPNTLTPNYNNASYKAFQAGPYDKEAAASEKQYSSIDIRVPSPQVIVADADENSLMMFTPQKHTKNSKSSKALARQSEKKSKRRRNGHGISESARMTNNSSKFRIKPAVNMQSPSKRMPTQESKLSSYHHSDSKAKLN